MTATAKSGPPREQRPRPVPPPSELPPWRRWFDRTARLGTARNVTGVACAASSQPVHGTAWRLGGVDLPAQNLLRIALPIPGVQGLVSSDMLFRFGSITLDYTAGHLLLG